jgi:hypothetical protein
MGRQAIEPDLTMGSESPSAALGPSGKAPTVILRRQLGPIDRFGPTLLGDAHLRLIRSSFSARKT